jgi:flagellar assembly protein FliH
MQISRYDALYLKDFFAPEMPEALESAPDETEIAPEPEPQFFSEEERNAAFEEGKQEGMASGYEKGYAEAKAERAQHEEEIGLAIQSLASTLDTMHSSYQLELQNATHEAHKLALMAAKKVADSALDKNVDAMMASMLERTMPMVMRKPEIAIEVHPDILEQVQLKLHMVMERAGYEGSTHIQANSNLGIHDIRIDWKTGQAKRDIGAMWQAIEDTIARFHSTPTTPEPIQE